MSHFIPAHIAELAVERLTERINNLKKENTELQEKYDDLKKDYEIISNYNIELLKKCNNSDMKIDAFFWKEEYRKLLEEYNKLKQ